MKLLIIFLLISLQCGHIQSYLTTTKIYSKPCAIIGSKCKRVNEKYLSHQPQLKRLFVKANPVEAERKPYQNIYFLIWLAFTSYAFLFSPGGSTESQALDAEVAKEIILHPFDGTVTPIFTLIFNSLGIVPLVFGALLLPGNRKQKVPATPFVIASFALGYFAIGPYLGPFSIMHMTHKTFNRTLEVMILIIFYILCKGLRQQVYDVSTEDLGGFAKNLESKVIWTAALGFALLLTYYGFFGSFDSDRYTAYAQLFASQRLPHVSSLDLTILSVVVSTIQ
jgi:hypothetical protein